MTGTGLTGTHLTGTRMTGTRMTGTRRGGGGAAVALAVALLIPAGLAAQQGPRDRLLVDAEWLRAHAQDDDLVLLHVGPESEYAAGHIPGARHVTLDMIAAPEDHDAGAGLSLQLPEPAALARTLEGLGVSDGSRIVVYWGPEGWATPAARVVFTLDWIGLGSRTSVLQGGMDAWTAAGGTPTSEVAAAGAGRRAGRVTPRPRADLVVDADWVLAHLEAPEFRIVDARAEVHYDGIQPSYLHRQPVRLGHIPGAANVPVFSVLDEHGNVRSEAELRALFEGAGVRPGQTVVGYCHLGQFATLMLFAARTLGYDVKLYDGSFQDWGSQERLPVELPTGG